MGCGRCVVAPCRLVLCLCRLKDSCRSCFFFFQAEDGIRDTSVTGVQTCALPIFFTEHDFGRALVNSVFVAGSTMVLDVVAVSLAGYSLSRLDLRFKSWIMYAVLLLQTMPLSATMVPIYGLARALGLRNSYVGLILIHAAIELPFLIWLMKNFFDNVPRYLVEAAWLD